MASALSSHLTELLESAVAPLPSVVRRRMFGSNGFFVDGKVFVLEWKSGIVLRLPDDEIAARLLREGATPWSPLKSGRPLKNWLTAPERFFDDEEALQSWVRTAYELVSALNDTVTQAKRPTKQRAARSPSTRRSREKVAKRSRR